MEIPLTQGKVAVVDNHDAFLAEHKWQYNDTKNNGNGYAVRNDGDGTRLYMHRVIVQATGDELVRHRNGDNLDNRRDNLLKITRSQRAAYSQGLVSSTGYRGVYAIGGDHSYRALITVNGGARQIGMFDTPEIAALMYDVAALEYYGESAILNFPGKTPGIDLHEAMNEYRRLRARRAYDAGQRTAPYVGVSIHTAGKYRATIQVDGKQQYLGSFLTPEEAARAYDAASRRLYGSKAFANFARGNQGDQNVE